MVDKIDSFRGRYWFLSNFYPCVMDFEGITYPSSEHAFQAAKSHDRNFKVSISQVKKPGKAKSLGWKVKCRDDWDDVRVDVMRDVLKAKFGKPNMARMLLETGDAHLEEGNFHGDVFWGTVRGQGENWLGRLLMEVRDNLKEERDNG